MEFYRTNILKVPAGVTRFKPAPVGIRHYLPIDEGNEGQATVFLADGTTRYTPALGTLLIRLQIDYEQLLVMGTETGSPQLVQLTVNDEWPRDCWWPEAVEEARDLNAAIVAELRHNGWALVGTIAAEAFGNWARAVPGFDACATPESPAPVLLDDAMESDCLAAAARAVRVYDVE
jgi:hypothetical protein